MFGTSDPRIYGKMNIKGWAERLAREDFYTMFAPLTNKRDGWMWDPDRKVIRQGGTPFLTAETPWVHIKGAPKKHCGLDHHIIFNTFGIIHPRCQKCWKVVVTPTTFKGLIELEEIQRGLNRPSKLGIEMRDYTPKFYGGYFYNHSIDEGRARYEEVRKAVNEHMTGGKDINVILKRGCTEFEMIKGPSQFWHNTIEEEEFLELLEAYIDYQRGNGDQARLVQTHVRLKWLLWAHANNDMSYVEYNGGETLFPGYTKYHEGDIDDIKHDLALCQSMAKTGIDQDKAEKFLVLTQEFCDKHKVPNIGAMIHVLGAYETNPMRLSKINLQEEVPDELKGDHDETT